ncbi:MAG TPA: hypothetical protein VGF67_32175 [Ktedonobacteraceae bacterium]
MFQKDARLRSGKRPAQDLDERLAAYYGPALPPHPLAEAAWVRLRDSLDRTPRVAGHRQPARQSPARRARGGRGEPPGLRDTFADLLQQIDYRQPFPALRCHFVSRQVQPRVRGVPLGRRQVQLILPARTWQSLQAVELEVLLAVGLARAAEASRVFYLLSRALFALCLLLVLATLPFAGSDRRSLGLCCLACICCLVEVCLVSWHERTLAFRCDLQAAQWLGRERVCRGLHLLAEHGRPRRCSAWGEPSLARRIARICGSPLKTKDEHLTLVG